MNGKIWAVSGHARAGKDTVGERLVSRHGFQRVAFADPMKRFVAELFDFAPDQVWGGRKDDQDQRYPRAGRPNLTPREALQTLGTEFGRACYPGIWIEFALRVAKRMLADRGDGHSPWTYDPRRGLVEQGGDVPSGVVITDARFKNELEAVRAAGGVLVRVTRPGCDGAVGVAKHASEAEQDSIPDSFFDLVIDNSGTLAELFEAVDWAARGAERPGDARIPRGIGRMTFRCQPLPGARHVATLAGKEPARVAAWESGVVVAQADAPPLVLPVEPRVTFEELTAAQRASTEALEVLRRVKAEGAEPGTAHYHAAHAQYALKLRECEATLRRWWAQGCAP